MNKRKLKMIGLALVFLIILSSFNNIIFAKDDFSNIEVDHMNNEKTNNNENSDESSNLDSDSMTDNVVEDINTHYNQNNLKDGWQKIDGKWYYYEDGNIKTGWLNDGSKWYYLDNNGIMLTGWQKIDGKWYYLKPSGAMATGWQKIDGIWYYFKPSGAMATGWREIDGKWYYLKSSGAMHTGWLKINGKWYYLKPSGAMTIGWQKIENQWYYFKSNGEMVTGDYEIKGKINSFTTGGRWQGVWEKNSIGIWFKYPDGTYPKNQWAKLGGKWYHFDEKGYMLTHWLKINNKWYYLGKDGVMRTGWIKVNGKWYYMNDSGAMQTGWLKLGDKTYYLHNNGAMHTGWLEMDNKRYYMNESGAMYTGWLELDGNTYYFNNSGVMHTGWLKFNNSWYFMDNNGIMQTGWVKVNGKWYYMDNNGIMQTGWIKVNNKWYYMNQSGAMHTGWLELNGKIYYFDSSGAMQTGWVELDNTWYLFGNDGLLQQKSIYNITFEEALAEQMKVKPQTDYYGGGWKNAQKEDVAFFLNPKNFYREELPAIRVTATALNFRSSPDSSSSDNIITTLKKNEIYVLMEEKDNWCKIIAKDRIGWVYGNYVELTTIENNQMFQFLDLSKNAGISSADIDKILYNKGILHGQGKTFVKASKQHKINEIYLVAHALLETDHGTSELANGVLVTEVDGKPVEPKVVYNMFGIGAYDRDPVRLGAEHAYKQGWFTPEQAIIGGAKFVGERYIYRQNNMQNTLYKMRWNPEMPGTHQYATDIAWAYKQVRMIKELYDLCTDYNLYFDIPQYK